MNLSGNDFAHRELSIDELETIAAGGWFSNLVHDIGHDLNVGLHWLGGPGLKYTVEAVTWIAHHLPGPVVYNGRKP